MLVATPAYLRKHGTPKVPADLTRHDCVLFNYPPTSEWTLFGPDGEVRVRVTGTFKANNGHVIRGAILSGLGVGWIPESLIYDKLGSGAVKQVLTNYAMQPLEVHALYSSSRHLPAKVRVFLDFLQEEFHSIPGFTAA